MIKLDKVALVCAVIGTILVWLPILIMLITSIIGSISAQMFLMDYLLPAEFFFVELIGWVLLVAASLMTQVMKIPVLITAILTPAALIIAMLVASLSGLTSGAIEAEGFIWMLILGMIGVYDVLVAVMGVLGIKLIVDIHSM
jgi:hypothetical protein